MSGSERDLSQKYPGSPDREPMALGRARLILQGVVDTPEDILIKDDLDRIGDHNVVEIKEALTVIGIDLLTTHPHKDKWAGLSLISKQTPHGKLTFRMAPGEDPIRGAGHVGEPEILRMDLVTGTGKEGKYVLESSVLLEDRRAPWVQHVYKAVEGFSDWRGQKPDVIFMREALEDVRKGKMDKLQKFYHGLRWVSYNMLNWDNDFKLPEDINKSPLPTNA